MANYYASWRSNHFKVKDAVAFEKEMGGIPGVTCQKQDSETYILLGEDIDSAGIPSFNADTEEEIDLLEVVSHHLPDDEVAILMEVGAEKLRYLVGVATAINNRGETRQVTLQDIYVKAKELAPGKDISVAEY